MAASQMTMAHQPQDAGRQVLWVGLVVGLCIMGDSFMYSVLPLEAERLGIALPLVGVLLSANRLVRLFSNTWISALFERWGPGRPFVVATILSLITTALYGAGWGFTLFLLARLGWGVAWSSLRQAGYQAIWMGESGVRGRLTGLLWGIVRMGSALGVILGGYLRDLYSYEVAIGALALLAALSVGIATRITWPAHAAQGQGRSGAFSRADWVEAFGVADRRWLLITGVSAQILGATVVSTTSIFLASRLPAESQILAWLGIGALSGFVLSVRWTASFFVGPAIGALSDRLGQLPTLAVLALLMAGAVLGALFSPPEAALLFMGLVMLVDAGIFVTLDAAASIAAHTTPRPHLFMGIYATVMDGGSALGPLLAYLFVENISFTQLYLVMTALFGLMVWQWRRVHINF